MTRQWLVFALPQRLWTHISDYCRPNQKHSVEEQLFISSQIRHVCFYAKTEYGVTDDALDTSLQAEFENSVRLRELRDEQRKKERLS
jgi:hypothetical protein